MNNSRAGRLGPREAAEILNISVGELLESAGEGRIPDSKLDRAGWWFKRSALVRLAAVRTSAPAGAA